MSSLSDQERLDLAYHLRCRAVAGALGARLIGSTLNDGFTYKLLDRSELYEMPHAVMETIERMLTNAL